MNSLLTNSKKMLPQDYCKMSDQTVQDIADKMSAFLFMMLND